MPDWHTPHTSLPEDGIYWFFEEGEHLKGPWRRMVNASCVWARTGYSVGPGRAFDSIMGPPTDLVGTVMPAYSASTLGGALLRAPASRSGAVEEWLAGGSAKFPRSGGRV